MEDRHPRMCDVERRVRGERRRTVEVSWTTSEGGGQRTERRRKTTEMAGVREVREEGRVKGERRGTREIVVGRGGACEVGSERRGAREVKWCEERGEEEKEGKVTGECCGCRAKLRKERRRRRELVARVVERLAWEEEARLKVRGGVGGVGVGGVVGGVVGEVVVGGVEEVREVVSIARPRASVVSGTRKV